MSSTVIRAENIHAIDETDDPFLLTPGPLTTSTRTKQAMMKDWGSWDASFNEVTADVRRQLVAMCDGADDYDCVPVQGSGTFAVEAMLGSFLPRDSKTLVLINGAYGKRIAQTLDYLGRAHVDMDKGDYLPPRGDEVGAILDKDTDITHVVVVHCETSSGILNPVQEIYEAVAARGRKFFIDSMSAFGAVPLEVSGLPFDAMVSSANKCIEGCPGFGFVVARTDEFEAARGNSHSLSLDLYEQWTYMNKTGQWRFTPPTHIVVAFHEALAQHAEEGGVAGRLDRYLTNRQTLVAGMREIGFETLLDDRWLSPIITTFFSPSDPAFEFKAFYDALKARGFIIYPGKLTDVDSFRIGNIGQMNADVMNRVVAAVAEVCEDLGISERGPAPGVIENARKGL